MNYHEAMMKYSYGLLSFVQLIAMKFDKETQEETQECEHSLLERKRDNYGEYCNACGEYLCGPDSEDR